MKVVILAGGFGTRLAELTTVVPKPMVEIGGKPILLHLMNYYASFGHTEFILALGYKGELIKRYFLDFYALNNNLSLNLFTGEVRIQKKTNQDWTVDLIDTGVQTQTGGRLKRLREWIGSETFLMTYGDGLSDIDLSELVSFHKQHGRLATVTAVRPPARFGGLVLNGNCVEEFVEKNQAKEGHINGGFFVLEPKVLDYIDGEEIAWEKEPLEKLSQEQQLMAYLHDGFWQPMDTLRECRFLEGLWASGEAPWSRQVVEAKGK